MRIDGSPKIITDLISISLEHPKKLLVFMGNQNKWVILIASY
jgi:hypothetical protein